MHTFLKYILIAFITLYAFFAKGQISDSDITTAYIYRFTDYLEWPEKKTHPFHIGIFSKNEQIIDKLTYLANTRKVKGLPVTTSKISNLDSLKNKHFDIIYIDKKQKIKTGDILSILKDSPTLLISNQSMEKEAVMINFIPSEKEGVIRFEVNKKNIIDQGLIVNPDIILLGGSFIDVRELFHEKEEELEAERKKLENSKLEIVEKLKTIKQQDSLITVKDDQIDNRNLKIENQRLKLLSQQSKLDSLLIKVHHSKLQLKKSYTTLGLLGKTIDKHRNDILVSEQKLKQQENILNEQSIEIRQQENNLFLQQKKIKSQNKVLNEQNTRLQLQRKLIIGGIIIVFLILALAYFIYRGLRTKKRNNDKLRSLNQDLSHKNEIIENQNIELKATLQNLKETQTQLFQAEKMASLGILTSGVAHEINNPLNYIMGSYIGLSDYFEENIPKDPIQINILLSSLNEGVQRASKIVSGLNEFSRNTISLHEDCNLHTIIDNCLAIVNSSLQHRVEVTKKYHSEELICKGNVGKLHQVFLNLLSNASQAIPGKGIIELTTQKTNTHYEIFISDTGEGISPENINKITDPFFTTKDPGKGTGLGLSITYSIINEHNGKLFFESELGKGTTAKVILPA
jgi:signal transduction histidine kinase